MPAIVLCTSGTAAANFHPAVLEAHHGRVPMIVSTADRPPELRDTGAGQTLDQAKLYGDAVRWYCDPGPPEDRDGVGATWRALASRAVHAALGPPAGPVHLNLPFREPLIPTGAPLVDAPGRSDNRPWTARAPGVRAPSAPMIEAFADLVGRTPRGVVLAGWGAGVEPSTVLEFADAAGWPVLADPVSGLRVPGTISTYDPLLRVPGFADGRRPDLVFRLGATPTNKPALQWLDPDMPQVHVDPDDTWLDPAHAVSGRLLADPELLLTALDRRARRVGGCGRGMARRVARRGRCGARGDRRPARRLDRAVRGSRGARRRGRGARRRRTRRRVEHADPRRRELRRRAQRRARGSRTAA